MYNIKLINEKLIAPLIKNHSLFLVSRKLSLNINKYKDKIFIIADNINRVIFIKLNSKETTNINNVTSENKCEKYIVFFIFYGITFLTSCKTLNL
jgi:hypothetical protein